MCAHNFVKQRVAKVPHNFTLNCDSKVFLVVCFDLQAFYFFFKKFKRKD